AGILDVLDRTQEVGLQLTFAAHRLPIEAPSQVTCFFRLSVEDVLVGKAHLPRPVLRGVLNPDDDLSLRTALFENRNPSLLADRFRFATKKLRIAPLHKELV